MAWKIDFTKVAQKNIDKLDKQSRDKVLNYIHNKIAGSDNPRIYGKPLVAHLSGLWRYRVEKYRIVCQIKDNELLILVVEIGKRDKVYD
jgi:mRNA interferase RelE/StbE